MLLSQQIVLLVIQTLPSQRRGEGDEDEGLCSICMDRPLEAQISGCDHQVCNDITKSKGTAQPGLKPRSQLCHYTTVIMPCSEI